MIDVSKFTTRPDIGTEEDPTIKDDAEEEETVDDDMEEEETIEEDEAEAEPTDEEENDTVSSVPPKRSFGPDLGVDNNLTTAPTEEPAKLIFSSCQIDFPSFQTPRQINEGRLISCNVPGASPGDNVVVSSTQLDRFTCLTVASSRVSEPNVVSVLLQRLGTTFPAEDHDHDGTFTREDGYHGHTLFCEIYGGVKGTVIFSIIVFRPEVPDIIGTLEELQRNDSNTFPLR